MKKLFMNSSINFINKYYDYSDNDIKKLNYGLEGIYLTISKTIIIFLVALLLDILKEVIIVLVLFNLIRYTGFGFHAEKSYQCLICSLINFVLLPLFFLNIQIPINVSILLAGVCIINFFFFAPADTVKRPLPNKRKRIIRKILTVTTGIIYTLLMYILNDSYFTSLLLTSLIIEVIVINPLTYKFFKQPYNNYKNLNSV